MGFRIGREDSDDERQVGLLSNIDDDNSNDNNEIKHDFNAATSSMQRLVPRRFSNATPSMIKRSCTVLAILSLLCLAILLMTASRKNTVESCIMSRGASVVTKGSRRWDTVTMTFNSRLSYAPALVVPATTVEHIQAAVVCAKQYGLRVSAKSGGHSFGSHGLGGEDGHVVISLDGLNTVQVRPDNSTLIQPGALLGHVALELYNQGGRALPHGVCPGVGMGGHALHGGIGQATRTYGLTLDWMKSAKVVTGDGTVMHCSNEENSDVFWAIRGAGSSFGIVIEMEFDTFEAPSLSTHFTMSLHWDEEDAVRGIMTLQDFMTKTAPKELNMMLLMTQNVSVIDGLFFGPANDLKKLLQPLLHKLDHARANVEEQAWIPNLDAFAYGETLEQPRPHTKNMSMYATAAMTGELLETQVASLMAKTYATFNDSSILPWSYMLEMFGGPLSAVQSTKPSATSFAHRDKLFLHQFNIQAASDYLASTGFSLLQRFRQSVTDSMPEDHWGMYANYVDSQLESNAAQSLYWGDNVARLQKIKAQVDPQNIFWNPQGIRPQS